MSKILHYAAAGMAMASLGVASTANAATSDQAQVRAEILTALSVEVDPGDNTLDFAQIAPGASLANVVVGPDGVRTCPAAVICAGAVNAPRFLIEGRANETVFVTFANPSETLTSGAATMTASAFTTNLTGGQVQLSGTGTGEFTVGGSLAVGASQPGGTYTGVLTVNVAYN